MAKTFSVKVLGIPQVKRLLKKTNKKTFNNANKAVHDSGFLIEGEVKQSIAGRKAEPKSVDTGRFLNSINTDNTKELESRVFSNVNYAKFLEFGTRGLSR